MNAREAYLRTRKQTDEMLWHMVDEHVRREIELAVDNQIEHVSIPLAAMSKDRLRENTRLLSLLGYRIDDDGGNDPGTPIPPTKMTISWYGINA